MAFCVVLLDEKSGASFLSQSCIVVVQNELLFDTPVKTALELTVVFNLFLENTYRVHVFTGDISSAGTNSNVFICVYGELGDSGERKLEKSETHMDKFERNNVRRTFFLSKRML